MLTFLHSVEAKIAGILPGLKTKLTLALTGLWELAVNLDPELVKSVVPDTWQKWVTLVLVVLAYEFHRMTGMHA